MALTICPVCGKKLSDKAHTCPHCGSEVRPAKTEIAASTKKYNKRWAVVLAILGISLITHIILLCVGFYDKGSIIEWNANAALLVLCIDTVIAYFLTFKNRWKKMLIVLLTILMLPTIVYIGDAFNPHNTDEYLNAQHQKYLAWQQEIQSQKEVNPIVGEYDIEDCWTMGAITWRLVVNEYGSCTLRYVEGEKIAYGSWKRIGDGYRLNFDDFQPVVHFPNDNPMNPKGLHYPYIDEGIEWIYQDSNAFDAKNPNKRLPIKRIE